MKTKFTRYFRDLPNGKTLRLDLLGYFDIETAPMRRSEKPMAMKAEDGRIMVGVCRITGGHHPVMRAIQYKANVLERHECDARCMNGQCNGVCECRCGGANHGKGSCVAA